MKLSLAEAKYFKESVGIISDLVSEARFLVTKDGMSLIVMDPASVVMVVYNLLPGAFTEFEVKERSQFTINLTSLRQVMRRTKPNDVLTLEVDTEKSKLIVTLKGGSNRKFMLPLLEMDEKEQKVPDLKFTANIETAPEVLSNAVEDADIVAESVGFVAEEKRMLIKAEGDLSQADIEIPADDTTKISLKDSSVVKSKYSIEYLKKMIGAGKIAEKLNISFSKDYPLRLDYRTVDRVSLAFILAPRVDND